MRIHCLCLLFLFVCYCEPKTKEEWRSRIIYQLLTDRFASEGHNPPPCNDLRSYCGGNFRGIVDKLDYISGLGANAIWISPIVVNTPLGYHGYWAKNIYEVNPNFGSEEDLIFLISECHKRDIWVMVDVVANHMGYTHGCFWSIDCSEQQLVNFTGFTPFDKFEHYHQLCEIENWKNQTEIEICRLAKLPDLNQTNKYVRSTLLEWISDLTKKYNIDGYRVDTVVEVGKEFWTDFQTAAGAFCLGEANNGENMTYVAEYQGPLDSVLNFPLYWTIRKVLTENQSMTLLKKTFEKERTEFRDVKVLGNFIDNHDFPRFLNLKPHTTLLMNSVTVVLLSQGIPIVYYGTEQGFNGAYDPLNREALWPIYNGTSIMYKFISTVSMFRRQSSIDFSSEPQVELYVDDDFLIFARGNNKQVIAIICNKVNNTVYTKTFPLAAYKDGTVFQNIADESDTIRVEKGSIKITLERNMPKIYQTQESITRNQGNQMFFSHIHVVIMLQIFITWKTSKISCTA